MGHKKTKLNNCHHMLTSSTQLQNKSFHVVERTRTSSKCQKMKNARAKRAEILFFIVKYANLGGFLPSSSWLLKLPNSLLKRASFAQLTRAAQNRRQHKQRKAGAGALNVPIVDNFDSSDNAYSNSIPSLKH